MGLAAGVGLMTFPFSGPAAFWRWVDLLEEGGVDSYWQSDRLVSDEPILESMSVMAALAGRTRKLKFGMNVVSLAFREPLLIAKECATIDMLSEGRLLPAFGIGSPFSADWKALGVTTKARGRRTDEALGIIEQLWRGETVDFESEHFHYRGARISPLPVQQPLPLWLGGSSKAAIRRTARFGTGWIGGRETPAETARVVSGVLEAQAEFGREVPDDHFGASFFFRFGSPDEPIVAAQAASLRERFPDRDPFDAMVVGGVDDIMARIDAHAAGGVTKFVLRPLGEGDDEVMAQTRRMVEEVLPAVDSRNASAKAARAAAVE